MRSEEAKEKAEVRRDAMLVEGGVEKVDYVGMTGMGVKRSSWELHRFRDWNQEIEKRADRKIV